MGTWSNWRVTIKRIFPKPVMRRVAFGLNTNNLGEIYKALLTSVASGGVVRANLVDVNGSNRNLIFKFGITQSDMFWSSYWAGNNVDLFVLGQLGTGNRMPSRSDRDLEMPLPGLANMGTVYSGGVVTLTSSLSYSDPVSPSEVGLFIELGNGSQGGKTRYLLDRTVFPPLPSGNVFTIRYDVNLG